MALNVKTPAGDVVKPKDPGKGGPGQYNGEKGYQKRTPSPNAMPEKTYDGAVPSKGKVNVKTPASNA